MTLRARLLAGLVLVLIALGLAGALVIRVQREYLFDQLDQRLSVVPRGLNRPAGPTGDRLGVPPGGRLGPLGQFSDVYVGRIGTDGRLETLLTPDADPTLEPDVTNLEGTDAPVTRSTVAGKSSAVRLITAPLADGSEAVIAIPTLKAEDAIRRLAIAIGAAGLVIAAIVGLVVWWVIRLGLRPIREMTEAADAISAGATERRVDVPPDRTEAGRLGVALNTMIDTNQESEARLRRFVADASHELRTPLTTLRGYTSLYESGGLTDDEAVRDSMRRMNSEATRMARIVEDLLLLAELDEHGPRRHDTFDLAPCLRDAVSDMQVVAPARAIRLEAPDSLPVVGDADQLVQVVAALTTNALRYTEAFTEIVLRAASGSSGTRVEIVDHGPGIPPADAARVFDRFYRADTGRSRAAGGNGLGLAIVASIMTAHEGRYGVVPTPGSGATFWIEIPHGVREP